MSAEQMRYFINHLAATSHAQGRTGNYGVGAKVAKPDAQVLVLHGDGSYGINAMEIDTAVRHKVPVIVVISNNGGWTADAPWTRPLPKPVAPAAFVPTTLLATTAARYRDRRQLQPGRSGQRPAAGIETDASRPCAHSDRFPPARRHRSARRRG